MNTDNTCTNISTVHPVDEFICSNCGIILVDWSRVVVDTIDDVECACEYTFEYCPNCGRKVVDE